METHTLDAAKEPLGRVAAKAAALLLNKHKASFVRHRKDPVEVVITNSDRLLLTGRKEKQKTYYRHSGYLGNLKEMSAGAMRARDSRKMVTLAVSGMLPKNRLRRQLMKRLVVHKGSV